MSVGWIINLGFAFTMLLYSIIVCLSRSSRFPGWKRWREKLSRQADRLPTTLATLGILGTFIGIFLGLLGFNVRALQASIPGLLDGLKIAFFTSICGLSLGLAMKLFFPLKEEGEDPILYLERMDRSLNSFKTVLAEKLDAATHSLFRFASDLREELIGKLESIAYSLVGEGETTLITQIQKLRLSLLDKQDEMIAEFRRFANTMAEINVQKLVEALNEVIRDFDAKINEKLGESFDQLRRSVEKLLEWQQKYSEQVQEMTNQLEKIFEMTSNAEESMAKIAQDSRVIFELSQEMKPILEAIRGEVDVFERNLEAFSKLAQEAQKALPEIEERLNRLTTVLAQKVEEILSEAETALRKQTVHTEQLLNNYDRVMGIIRSDLEKLVEETRRSIEGYIELVESELEEALEKSLKSLGNSLAALSRKFAEDYTPLTDRLREIVRIAEQVDRDVQGRA